MNDKLTQAILGFRLWPLTPDGLGAATSRKGWQPGVNQAECQKIDMYSLFGRYTQEGCEHAPQQDCACGLYAWHTLDQLAEYNPSVGMRLYGAVAGWGRMFSHHDGWRSEYARVVAFAVKDDTPFMRAIAQVVADQYKVPLVPFDMLQLQGALHAQPMPAEHIPERQVDDYSSALMQAFGSLMYGQASIPLKSGAAAKKAKSRNPYLNQLYWPSPPSLPKFAFTDLGDDSPVKPATPGEAIAEIKKKQSAWRPPDRRSSQWRQSR